MNQICGLLWLIHHFPWLLLKCINLADGSI